MPLLLPMAIAPTLALLLLASHAPPAGPDDRPQGAHDGGEDGGPPRAVVRIGSDVDPADEGLVQIKPVGLGDEAIGAYLLPGERYGREHVEAVIQEGRAKGARRLCHVTFVDGRVEGETLIVVDPSDVPVEVGATVPEGGSYTIRDAEGRFLARDEPVTVPAGESRSLLVERILEE